MKLQEYKKELLKNKKFKKEYEKYDLAFEIGKMIIKARMIKGITQEKLAQLANTKQPSIARIENGQSLPSLSFLQRIAKALNLYLKAPQFETPRKVTKVKPMNQQKLEIKFDDNKSFTFDVKPYIYGEIFEALRDEAFFKNVKIDGDFGSIYWENGADFGPDFLYGKLTEQLHQ